MNLGAFSVSLAVKNITISKAFYENLGFEQLHGDIEQNWVIMKNREHVIGLFQGMFENNILTFNPGWNQSGESLEQFTDIREIQKILKEQDMGLLSEIDEATAGPANFMIADPDGNVILLDQHV